MIVVIAQPEEIKLVKELGYENNPIIITGVGGVNVIRALKDLPKDTEILNIGYCGSNSLEIGTKVFVDEIHTFHPNVEFCEKIEFTTNWDYYNGRTFDCYACYTSTDFVTNVKISTVCVFDMELAFIASMFPKISAIKVVSDNLNYKEYKNSTK